jgi:hypothetical protein
VRDASESSELRRLDFAREFGNATHGARALQLAIGVNRDAAGIVSAIFEPLQPFHQDVCDVARSDGADDAAHNLIF